MHAVKIYKGWKIEQILLVYIQDESNFEYHHHLVNSTFDKVWFDVDFAIKSKNHQEFLVSFFQNLSLQDGDIRSLF